jgi:hypothetical protein
LRNSGTVSLLFLGDRTDHIRATGLEYNRWYNVGLAWGGPDNDVELWVDGALAAAADLPAGLSFPWGFGNAGTNIGIGGNHERGYGPYGSTSGVSFSSIQIWDEYRVQFGALPSHTLGVRGTAKLQNKTARSTDFATVG